MRVGIVETDPLASFGQRRAASQQPDQLAAPPKTGWAAPRPEDLLQFNQLAAFEAREIKRTWHAFKVACHAFFT